MSAWRTGTSPCPRPGPGQVLVEVGGCGLNHLEVWAVQSPPSHRRSEPRTPGADVAGTVTAIGTGVKKVNPGDRVVVQPQIPCHDCRYCLTGRDNMCPAKYSLGSSWDGGLAEYVVVPEWNAIPLPDSISLVDAASLPIVFITTWHMLVARARVRPGDTVLVNAAGSGVGIAAIQIARLFGATVLASAGSEPKLQKARELGAEGTFNYSTHSLYEEVMRLTGGLGVDIVIDSLAGDLMEQSVEALAPGRETGQLRLHPGQLGPDKRGPYAGERDDGHGIGRGLQERARRGYRPRGRGETKGGGRPGLPPFPDSGGGCLPGGPPPVWEGGRGPGLSLFAIGPSTSWPSHVKGEGNVGVCSGQGGDINTKQESNQEDGGVCWLREDG